MARNRHRLVWRLRDVALLSPRIRGHRRKAPARGIGTAPSRRSVAA